MFANEFVNSICGNLKGTSPILIVVGLNQCYPILAFEHNNVLGFNFSFTIHRTSSSCPSQFF
jgi:hypothetical protein